MPAEEQQIEQLLWFNPTFFSQSGKLDISNLDLKERDPMALFEGNSILRN